MPEWPHLPLSPNEMYEVGIAKAGLLRIPAAPGAGVRLPRRCAWRTIQHYGVEVGGLRYNGAGAGPLPERRPARYGGLHAGQVAGPGQPGRRPVGLLPGPGRRLLAPAGLGARRRAGHAVQRRGRPVRPPARRPPGPLARAGQALAELLARWDQGMVTGRRERRMAARLAAERAALPVRAQRRRAGSPTAAARARDRAAARRRGAAPDAGGDDDDPAEIFDEPGDDDFYADAFEVLE